MLDPGAKSVASTLVSAALLPALLVEELIGTREVLFALTLTPPPNRFSALELFSVLCIKTERAARKERAAAKYMLNALKNIVGLMNDAEKQPSGDESFTREDKTVLENRENYENLTNNSKLFPLIGNTTTEIDDRERQVVSSQSLPLTNVAKDALTTTTQLDESYHESIMEGGNTSGKEQSLNNEECPNSLLPNFSAMTDSKGTAETVENTENVIENDVTNTTSAVRENGEQSKNYSIASICTEDSRGEDSQRSVGSSPSHNRSESSQVETASSVKGLAMYESLPKTASRRPPNSRVFIGNLASERTTVEELISVFRKYGTLIEEPVIRRSFGFVQYDNEASAYQAIEGEQGRLLVECPLTLVLLTTGKASNRVSSYVGPDRSRKTSSGDRFHPYDNSTRSTGRHSKGRRARRFDSRNGVAVRVLVMGQQPRGYAHSCEATIRAFLGVQSDVVYIEANKLGDSLELAKEQLVPYVIVVNSKDEREGTCSIRILENDGYQKIRGGSLPFREALNIIVEEEGLEQQVIMNMNALAPFGFQSGIPTPQSNDFCDSQRSINTRAARDSRRISLPSQSLGFATTHAQDALNSSFSAYGATVHTPSNINALGLANQQPSVFQVPNQSMQQQSMTQQVGYSPNPLQQTNSNWSNSTAYASLLNSLYALQNSSSGTVPTTGSSPFPNMSSSGQQPVDLSKLTNVLNPYSVMQQQPSSSQPSRAVGQQQATTSGQNLSNILQALQGNAIPSTGLISLPSQQTVGASSNQIPNNILQLLQQAQAQVAMAQQQKQQSSQPSQRR
eukprot:jgi/Galph1/1399/GphlegSOOS_G93.1